MAFPDEFAEALSNAGIAIDVSVIPSKEVLENGLDSLSRWLNSLDEATRSAVDEITAEFPVKFGLADPAVDIAPGLSAFLEACDRLQESLSITRIVDVCSNALQQPEPNPA